MTDCEYWHQTPRCECWGTKDREACSCGGNPAKCDFYPEKRETASKVMLTADMVLAARKDGKTYKVNFAESDMYYNSRLGFTDSRGCPIDAEDFRYVDDIMNLEWVIVEVISRREAEERFGIKIID